MIILMNGESKSTRPIYTLGGFAVLGPGFLDNLQRQSRAGDADPNKKHTISRYNLKHVVNDTTQRSGVEGLIDGQDPEYQ